ncbi:MAG TPA: glutamate--tRNA ligase [Terriglobales bacterium]|nr:glutamate--tRNA ligase [Terriglobales bacterium]
MSDPGPVRVRFAPSPTGWLHVGGARTAYFNWLFARRHGGAIVLRIEDTDVERSSGTSERGVLDDLAWLELDFDEGPEQGGAHGPYRQSERLELYRRRADELVAAGRAYPCFCTDDELEVRRAAAVAADRPPHYDGRCRRIPAAEREARVRAGEPHSIRFEVAWRDWVLHDLVRGEVTFRAGIVGDFVLLRSNGLPTYNFAAAVDDGAMAISHVIRAEEHLANTPRQLMLLDAMGLEAPRYAHVPLILNRDRTKMSKRAGEAAAAVGDWRQAGILPEALMSYLALLGFHPGDEREILSRAELLECFALERVGRSGSIFDPDKLRWVNAQLLHRASGAEILRRADNFLPEPARALPRAALERLLEAVRGNLATLADLAGELEPFLAERPAVEPAAAAALESASAREVCRELAAALERLAEWNEEGVKSALRATGDRLGLGGRELYQPARAAFTGRTHGPELPLVASLLGRARCVARLREAGGHP